MIGPFRALTAVLTLERVHFYNFPAVKFSHDPLQLPFWALAPLSFYRAPTREGTGNWLIAGVCLALAFWTKYSVFALAVPLGLFLLLDPMARRA